MKAFLQGFSHKVVIEEFVHLDVGGVHIIAPYSAILKARVERTQPHVFNFIYLHGSKNLEKWCKIKADRQPNRFILMLHEIKTLAAIKTHIDDFIRMEKLEIYDCNFLLSPVGEYFTRITPSLTDLTIKNSPTTLGVITSLLAALPQLKRLAVEDSKITDHTDRPSLLPTIPFFQGSNSLRLRYSEYDGEYDSDGHDLDWIPDSARFEELDIDLDCFVEMPALVNQWLSNSRTTLTTLAIVGNPRSYFISRFTLFDLSTFSTLTKLEVSIGLHQPGSIIEAVLSSITSSQLSVISLEWDIDVEGIRRPDIDYSAWGVVENHLLRLAKSFSAENPGKKMRVDLYCSYDLEPQRSHLLEKVESKEILSKLREEVDFSLDRPAWRRVGVKN